MRRLVLASLLIMVVVASVLSAGRVSVDVSPERALVVTAEGRIAAGSGDPFSIEAPYILFVFWTEDIVPGEGENYVDTWCTQLPSPILVASYDNETLVWNLTMKFFAPIGRSRYVILAQCEGSAWSEDPSERLDAVEYRGATVGGMLPYRYRLVIEPASASTANYTVVAQLFKPITALFSPTGCPASTPPELSWSYRLGGSEVSVSPAVSYGYSLSGDARTLGISIDIAFPESDHGKQLDQVLLSARYCGVEWTALNLSFAQPITIGNTSYTYTGLRIVISYSFTE